MYMSATDVHWNESRESAAATGMVLAHIANANPSRTAVIDRFGEHSFGDLNGRANQLLASLRAKGLGIHSGVALLCSNRVEFLEVQAAAQRGGMRLTPVNWHLTAEEIAYIVADSQAEAVIAEARFKDVAVAATRDAPNVKTCIGIGGELTGFEDYEAIIGTHPTNDPSDPALGSPMLYTSGTTGHPKGVYRWPPLVSNTLAGLLGAVITFRPESDLALVTGPLYHAAPLSLNALGAINSGVGLVLMDKWDAEETLALIERHKIVYTHVVATMFSRLLKLPAEVRGRYDLSSLRAVLHGAAPCPQHVKAAMIDWLGPVVYEYYAATEGGATLSNSQEWLERPGTVGMAIPGTGVRVLNDAKVDCEVNELGTVYLLAPDEGRFEYFKSPEKTAGAYFENYYTLGDQGHLDADGYLFLTGRSAETIISGGVNIYPQQIDDILLQYPGIHEACTVGVPNEEWGEEVKAVVEVAPGVSQDDAMRDAILAFCRERLAAFKCPRSVDFKVDLPRLPSGKIQRHKVRAPYWEGRASTI
jgi:long-chain acyl-CoA synthetase